MRNKKGFTYFFALMMAVLFFMVGLAIAPALNDTVDEARTRANCSSDTITSFQQGGCVIMDLYSPFLIGVVFSLAGFFLGGRAI